MTTSELKTGQEVWFQKIERSEHNKTVRSICHGVVMNIDKNNVTLKDDADDSYGVRSYECYKTEKDAELDMKFDLFQDKFYDQLCDASEKYLSTCTRILKGCTSALKEQTGQELLINDTARKMRFFGNRLKTSVSQFADSFIKESKDTAFDHMTKETRDLIFHTDLSKYEPLTDKDLDFGSNDNDIILTDADLRGISIPDGMSI